MLLDVAPDGASALPFALQQPSQSTPPAASPDSSAQPKPQSGTDAAAPGTPPKTDSSKPPASKKHKKKKDISPTTPVAPAPEGTASQEQPSQDAQKNRPATDPAEKAPDAAPKKKVVSHGGTDEPTVQISASMTEEQAAKSRAAITTLLNQTDDNLQKLSTRQLSADEKDTVDQIRKFEEQSKAADQQGDLPRAQSLANKAKLLSDALLNP